MNVTFKAILGRFEGDRVQALDYCLDVIEQHPQLRAEYSKYAMALHCGV